MSTYRLTNTHHKHKRVHSPQTHSKYHTPSHICRWIDHQVSKRPRLTSVQKQLLKALPGWKHVLDLRPADLQDLDTKCDEYSELASKLGRALRQRDKVPQEERRLGRWLANMKAYHKNSRGVLSVEQQQKLEQLPYFSWVTVSHTANGPAVTRARPQLD